MIMAKGLYRLARPYNALNGALAVALGGYVAGTGEWLRISLAALATLFVTGASNAWNDYLDVEIDRINQPQRPMPSGMVTPRAAILFSLICTAIAVGLAALINMPAVIVVLFSSALLYIYSWKLKSTVILGNATVATISAASALFGGLAAGNVGPSLWLVAVIAVAIMMREVLKTMADYDGDLAQRVRTVATVWGKQKARWLFLGLAVSTVVVMVLPSLLGHYRPIYLVVVVVGVLPVLIYILPRVRPEKSGPQLERLSQILKLTFLVWFLAVFLGAAV